MSILLLIGSLIFISVHLLPVAIPNARKAIVAKTGENPYKGIFILLILISLGLIIYGWRSGEPDFIYAPPHWGLMAAKALMLLSLILFSVAGMKQGNFKRIIRHPQLTAILVWAIAHLLANGDIRSLTLFGIFALWVPLQVIFLNNRDGKWAKPEKVSPAHDIKAVIISIIIYGILMYTHEYFTGVALIS